jgi:hypothetical protein
MGRLTGAGISWAKYMIFVVMEDDVLKKESGCGDCLHVIRASGMEAWDRDRTRTSEWVQQTVLKYRIKENIPHGGSSLAGQFPISAGIGETAAVDNDDGILPVLGVAKRTFDAFALRKSAPALLRWTSP